MFRPATERKYDSSAADMDEAGLEKEATGPARGTTGAGAGVHAACGVALGWETLGRGAEKPENKPIPLGMLGGAEVVADDEGGA